MEITTYFKIRFTARIGNMIAHNLAKLAFDFQNYIYNLVGGSSFATYIYEKHSNY